MNRHGDTLRRLVQASMDHLHELAECPFCELGKRGEDLGCEDAKHDATCPLAGYELTVDLEALLACAEEGAKSAAGPLCPGCGWPRTPQQSHAEGCPKEASNVVPMHVTIEDEDRTAASTLLDRLRHLSGPIVVAEIAHAFAMQRRRERKKTDGGQG